MERFCIPLLITVLLGVTQANPTSRVLDGSNANFTQFPYQISLRNSHSHTCGGSIISHRSILTAAHCVQTDRAKYYTIRAGTINRIAGGVIVQVKNVKVHNETDVALLELEEDLQFSDHIQAIELFHEEVPDNSDIIISGWGLTVHGGAGPPIYLQYRHLNSISDLKCHPISPYFNESLLCLNHESGAGACSGDSGGPATYNGKLVGVASFVLDKCGTSLPDAYAKVSYNIDWIKKNMV